MSDSRNLKRRFDKRAFVLTWSCRCPECGHTWEAVAPLGSTGIECPACYEYDLDFEWRER